MLFLISSNGKIPCFDNTYFKYSNAQPVSVSIDNLIVFTAKEFHASLVTPFFVDFTFRILIEGFDLNTSMTHMLAATSQSHLARHTNVIHMYLNTQTATVDSTVYIFTNPRWRPWGNRLSPACPDCASPHSWSNVIKQGTTYSYSCRRDNCPGWCSFSKPEGFELCTTESNGGRWMKREYRV
jgi:hypothetical protein